MFSSPCPVAEGMKDELLWRCFPHAEDAGGSAKGEELTGRNCACRARTRNGSMAKSVLLLQRDQSSVPNITYGGSHHPVTLFQGIWHLASVSTSCMHVCKDIDTHKWIFFFKKKNKSQWVLEFSFPVTLRYPDACATISGPRGDAGPGPHCLGALYMSGL